MRDLMMFFAFLAMLPMALSNGFIAFLLWGWTGVILPNYYLFGFMQSMRYNFIFAVIAITALAFNFKANREAWLRNRTGILIILFLVHASLSVFANFTQNPNQMEVYSFLAKAIVFALVINYFVTNKYRLFAFIIVLCIGLSFHGVTEGGKFLTSGGGHISRGIGGMLSDNNHFGLGMVMTLPLLIFLYHHLNNSLAKQGTLFVILITALAAIGSDSRGAFIGLAIVSLWTIMISRRRLSTSLFFILSVALILYVAPDSFTDRFTRIETADSDASFLGRVAAWKISTAAALSNPFFGLGMHGIQIQGLWEQYIGAARNVPFGGNELLENARAAHSIYFEVLGDLGFLGLFLFLALPINAFFTRLEIKKLVRKLGKSHQWASDLSDSLALSLIAFLIAGASLSMAYFETFYAILVLMETTKRLLTQDLKNQSLPNPSEPGKVSPSFNY